MGDTPDAFESVTAVNDGPVPREALPTGAIRPLAKPDETRVPRAAGSVGLIPIDKGAHADSVAEQRGVPPIAEAPEQDLPISKSGYALSEARGMRPIAEPYARAPARIARGWLYAPTLVSLACLAVTVSAVVWARAEVESAHEQQATAATRIVTVPVAAEPPPPVAPVVAKEPCALRISASVRGAKVWIDGTSRGTAPITHPIECRETVLEVRHPRYEDYKRTVAPESGTVDIDVELERKRKSRRSGSR